MDKKPMISSAVNINIEILTDHSNNVSALISDLQVGGLSTLVTSHWHATPRQAVHNDFPSSLHPALADYFHSGQYRSPLR